VIEEDNFDLNIKVKNMEIVNNPNAIIYKL